MYVVSDFLVTNEQLARPRGRARRERGGRTEEGDWEREKARQAGRRATEKGAEQTGEVLVLDDRGGLHSLTPLHSSTHFVPGDRSFVVERISRFKELVKWGMGLVDSLMLYKMCYNPY